MLATKLKENRWKAAGLMAVGIALTVVACESRLPQEATPDPYVTKLDERPVPPGAAVVVDDGVLVPTAREGAQLREAPKVTVKKFDRMPTLEPLREDVALLPRKVDPDGEPHFTPYTKRPELRNRDVVGPALVRNYPPLLRDAGIGGTVQTWLLVNESGKVISARVKESSGRRELDAAALEVARIMEFTPAEHNGMPVNVWIAIPIVFKTQ